MDKKNSLKNSVVLEGEVASFCRSSKAHGVFLLLQLDQKRSAQVNLLRKKLYFLGMHFKLWAATKFLLNVGLSSEPRQDKLETCPASVLTQSRLFDYAEKNSITFKEKSLHTNPVNFCLEYLFALKVNNPNKFFNKRNF